MPNRDDIVKTVQHDLRSAFDARSPMRLADTPDFPLAFNVALPPDAATANGALLFRFRHLTVGGAATLRIAGDGAGAAEDRMLVVVDWDELTLDGRYELLAKPMPVVAMDTGGTMLDGALPDALPAGAAAVSPLDPAQQAAMLDQARQERTRLMDNPQGVQLMATYNEHNETYNTVFVTSPAARQAWAAEGTTKAMALHTHAALQPVNRDTIAINPPKADATFGPNNLSYNENAFNQQLQIAVNTVATDPNFDLYDPNAEIDPDSKYTKAALAALTFGNAVGQTGNSKTKTEPLSGDAVHGAVQRGTPPAPASPEELQNIVAQGSQPGGAAAATARARDWRVLDEADRTLVRRSLYAVAVERAERDAVVASPLWTGACGARISGASVRLVIAVDRESTVVDATVDLPAFELELDDSAWTGEAGELARKRLADAFFVSSLLRERIVGAISARAKGISAEGGRA